MYGVWLAGAGFAPLSPTYPPERIAYIQSDCKAKVVIDERFLRHIEEETPLTDEIETDFSAFEERSRLHDRLIKGNEDAENIFQEEFSDYCRNMWFTRLMRVFRGINPEDDKALADLSQKEQENYLLSKFTKSQLLAIQMMLANDEFNEIALNFITQAINNKE